MEDVDYLRAASTVTRERFVAAHPYLFLVGEGRIRRPDKPRSTLILDSVDSMTPVSVELPPAAPPRAQSELLLLAVRKVRSTFPDMITVGRTPNNDIVLADQSISKLHAFFRPLPTGFTLADAGSRNGTKVSGRPLKPRGPAVVLRTGDRVRFAKLEFLLLDAGDAWDAVRRTT